MKGGTPTVGFLLLAVGVLGLSFGGGIVSGRLSPRQYVQGGPVGMMGGYGGMMGGGYSYRGDLISNSDLENLVRQGRVGAKIDRANNTVTYGRKSVTLVALASPDSEPDMTWEIDGLVNPTVVVHPGAHVTVKLVNTDWGYMHGFELTQVPPPYSFMAMMGILNNFLLMPLPERTTKNLSTARYYASRGSFTAASGAYYYLCPVPGHAEQGMYGKFVVG